MKRLATILILIVTTLMMSGCGKINISGTYVSERNSNEYLEFSGESKVEYHLDGKKKSGSYRVVEHTVLIAFNSDENVILEAKDDKTLYDGLNAFVKKGFWEKHWWKFVIGWIALSIILVIYKKVTGRDLNDDIDKFVDKLDE